MFSLKPLLPGLLAFLLLFPALGQGQCMIYPVDLEEREADAAHIVLGKLVEQHPYWDAEHQNIYTLNIVEVSAWLKGYRPQSQIGVITKGGIVGNEGLICHPSLELQAYNEYVLLLEADNDILDHRGVRQSNPTLVQAFSVADAQGALTKQRGVFHDLLTEPEHTEASLLQRIGGLTGEAPRKPEGEAFAPREGDTFPLWAYSEETASRAAPITGIAPNPTNAGTVNTADFITVNGSGFGATAGSVFYTNADDGGATLISSGIATDNLSWADNQVENKPAAGAGTGPITINGSTSAGNLDINYAHVEVSNSFAGFAQDTRQVLRLVDQNTFGGYSFFYNNAFAANNAASLAFENALQTWVCATGVNFEIEGNTALATAAGDGTDVVFFSPTLPNGVLGRANTFFNASANGACNQTNTVWFVEEIDFEFKPDPPAGCCSWNFGPGASAFLEFDFESVALHEIGHAHGLRHVIAAGEVMHFAIANGVDARALSANDIAGGNAKMTINLTPMCFIPSGVNGNMTAGFSEACVLSGEQALALHAERTGPQEVKLHWKSFSEASRFSHFELTRSGDGEAFLPLSQWGGRSSMTVEEQFIDEKAGDEQTWFYRLSALTEQGKQVFSEVVQVESRLQNRLEVYPTVTQSGIHVEGHRAAAGTLQFQMIDLQGKIVLERMTVQDQGGFEQEFALDGLANGVYFFRASLGEAPVAGKVVVAR